MKTFILKHKRIILWLIFTAIVLFFAPKQRDHYLNSDINFFKTHYLTSILIWAGAVLSVIFLIILFVNTKSIKQSFLSFLYVSLIIACSMFIFQDIFLSGALFINRQFKRKSMEKVYVIDYLAGTATTKDNFMLYDISGKQISIERKLINKLYQPGLKQNDTITLKFEKGLFGIPFQSQPFPDK